MQDLDWLPAAVSTEVVAGNLSSENLASLAPTPSNVTGNSVSEGTNVQKYVERLHKTIPPRVMRWWAKHMKGTLKHCFSPSNRLVVSSACSCSDAWINWVHTAVAYWHKAFNAPHTDVEQGFKCEIDEDRVAFMIEQHDPKIVVGDVRVLSQTRVCNQLDWTSIPLPWSGILGIPFSCTSILSLIHI